MKKGFIFIWIISLMTITVVSAYSYLGQNDIQIMAEEEERSTGNNLFEELKIKAVSNLHDQYTHSGFQRINGIDNAQGLGCNPLYEFLISKINEIPPENFI